MKLEDKFELATRYLQTVLILFAPKNTGNLSLNAIRLLQVTPKHWQVYIGGELAPYGRRTNEVWASGLNPNQGWVDNAIGFAAPTIRMIMSGNLEYADLMMQQATVQEQIQEQFNYMAFKRGG